MKRKPSQKSEEDFQAWWTKTFGFSTGVPYYREYRDLYLKGADLDYIRSCHVFVWFGDIAYAEANKQRREAKKVGRRKRQIEPAAPVPKVLESAIKGYYRGYIERTFEKANEINPADPLLSLPLSRPLTPPLLQAPLTPRDVYVAARVEQLRREAAEHAWAYAIELLRNSQEEERKKEQQEVEAFAKQNPIAEVIKEYAPGPERYKEGGHGDLRGSFFLLAVTEHLREKAIKERYLLAARLLKKIRGQDPDSWTEERKRATARVADFKKSHANWNSHLRAFREQFSRRPVSLS